MNARKAPRGTLDLAVFGLGRVFERHHWPALRASSRFWLIGACDPSSERRLWLESVQSGMRVTDNAAALLEQIRPAAVLIATPPRTHAELAALALRAGAHVLVEKPMGIDVTEAARLVAIARAGGLKLQVGYMRRYSTGYRALRASLAAVEPRMIRSMTVLMSFDPKRWSAVSEDLRAADPWAVLHDVASHQLDLVSWLIGVRGVAVRAHRCTTSALEYELELGNGINVHGTARHGAPYREHVSVETDARLLTANPYGILRLHSSVRRLSQRLGRAGAYWHLATRRLRRQPNATALSFARQLDDFAARIAGEPGDGADGDSAIATHLALQAIAQSSARAGERIAIGENG